MRAYQPLFLAASIASFGCSGALDDDESPGAGDKHGHSHSHGGETSKNKRPLHVKPRRHAFCSGNETVTLNRFTEAVELGGTTLYLFVEPGVAAETVELVVSSVEGANALISESVIPAQVRVLLCAAFPAPRSVKELHPPQLVVGDDLFGADTKAMRAILVHEYGHAVFEEVLHSELEGADPGHPPHFEPFVELFSDALAVFVLDDGTAIRAAHEVAFPTHDFLERDFTLKHRPNAALASLPAAMTAPIRTLLWREYQKRLKAGETNAAQAILEGLAQASISAIRELTAGTTERPIPLVPHRINDLLFQQLIDHDVIHL